jgi:hypothetical protein
MKRTLLVFAFVLSPVWGQGFKFPASFEKLAAKAVETVDVTLDGTMLQVAGKFMSEKEPDQAKAKKLVSGLKGIYVKSFEFANEGEYSEADVEAIRSQLSGPEWTRIVTVRSKKDGENADIFFKKEGDRYVGIAVISAEPKELTFVHIDGPIDLEQLGQLGGQFGIPKIQKKEGTGPAKQEAK